MTFTLTHNKGNKVTYNWTYDDGEEDSVYDDKAQSHVYTSAGVYFVQLVAYNKISQKVTNVSGGGGVMMRVESGRRDVCVRV